MNQIDRGNAAHRFELIACTPFSARISRGACALNLKTALRCAEKINFWRPASSSWRFCIPGMDDIALSRFCACSRCSNPTAVEQKTLSTARATLFSMCRSGFATAEQILSNDGTDLFDGHSHNDQKCATL